MGGPAAPAPGTLEAWAFEVIRGLDLERKLEPPAPPRVFEVQAPERRLQAPSRPAPLRVAQRADRSPRPGALVRPAARARLLHVFLHHELQAAELFCWALLAFPESPEPFRRGLVELARDELRHARLLRAQVERLGARWGDFPVRDWFWERFVACQTPLAFVALMGIGFEGGNLDHCAIWAARLRAVGDEESARCQEAIGRDEVRHVAFAIEWFRRWTGALDFDLWRAALPAPLTPTVMRGTPLDHGARRAAGLDPAFTNQLEGWDRAPLGS